MSKDSLKTEKKLTVNGTDYQYYSLQALVDQGFEQVKTMPVSLKILLENLLRHEDGKSVDKDDIHHLIDWTKTRSSTHEIAFHPARVLMQDFTGVPGVVDLASMRDAVVKRGGDPAIINPLNPVDLVIDHSVMVDVYASRTALEQNISLEMKRNIERYEFLRWGQSAFDNFRVVPPGTGICHQVNLEYLAKTVWTKTENGVNYAYPDTLVGTDSHTPMINGIGVLGWGVGGIEAEAAMLGQALSMLIPEVIGVRLVGRLREGVTATDLVLTVTEKLRNYGVVGKFVEYFGEGLDHVLLADRATLSNMSPENGSTVGLFPVDQITLDYMHLTGRDQHTIDLVEAYAKEQGLWRDKDNEPIYSDIVELDLATVEPSLAGPSRPQDRVSLGDLGKATRKAIAKQDQSDDLAVAVKGTDYTIKNGDVVIAAITSCTNTSNPNVMLAAGLLAKKAVEKGLVRKPWVKSSLAPGSKVVTEYLLEAGLTSYLEDLGFHTVGYGCTTCIGNSGPLAENIDQAIEEGDLTVCGVLSGNRNYEGRIHPRTRANWLASPPLVVAFALAGTTNIDLWKEPIGDDKNGNAVYLKDIWPSNQEIQEAVNFVTSSMYKKEYAEVFAGDAAWQAIKTPEGQAYEWQEDSTYIQNPPFFEEGNDKQGEDIVDARILALFGDSLTTDHISPAGNIARDSSAGQWLRDRGVSELHFNSYGSRRGNHQVMMRGTFTNIRIKNLMLDNVEGGFTRHIPSGEQLPIFDAAMRYQEENTPLIVIAGKEYGTGSSRDWAAKGTRLLGVKAVITESYERIHRSNLVGMGILPLQFQEGQSQHTLGLDGSEKLSIRKLKNLKLGDKVTLEIERSNGNKESCELVCRIDTADELQYFYSGGILQYVLEDLLATATK